MSACVRVARRGFQPLGHLVFIVGLSALSLAAAILGPEDPLGYFVGHVSVPIWRGRNVTRLGLRVAFLIWAVAVVLIFALPGVSDWAGLGLIVLGVAAAVIYSLRAGRSLPAEKSVEVA